LQKRCYNKHIQRKRGKNMKKLLAILLALALLVSLIGCTSKVVEDIRTSQTTIGTEATTTVPEETTTTPTEPTEEELPPQIDQTDPPTTQPEPTEPPTTQPEPEPTVPPTTRPAPEPEPEPTVPPTTQPAPEPEPEPPTTQPEPEPEPEPEPTPQLDPDGSYTTKDDVALYLHLYGHLPKNFITKSEAKAQYGWKSGSLEKKAPGKCLGGDRFYNKEGRLPAGHTYYECDIDTLGSYASRGAKRIVYSDDGLIYYTDDHYETFTLLYSNFAVIDISALLFAVRFVY
jgi:guanyl-specific ribonuclease Sa